MAKENQEVNAPEIDPNLGISLDFGDTPVDPTTTPDTLTDDLLGSSLKETDTDKANLEDITPGAEDMIDLNAHLESLTNENETDSPGSSEKTTKKESTTTKKEDAPSGEEDTSGSLTIAYANILKEQGLSDFNEEELKQAIEEKGEAEALIDLLNKSAETAVTKKTEELDGYTQEYTKLRKAGFSQEDAGIMIGNLETVNSITEDQLKEDAELQEQIIREVATIRNISKEEIDDTVAMLKDSDKLQARAEQNLKQLQGYYKQVADNQLALKQKADQDRIAADKAYLDSLKENVYQAKEILKGKPINKQTQEALFDMITKPVKKMDNGQTLNAVWAKREENRQDFDIKLAYFIKLGLFDGKIDKLAVDARTKATDNLKKIIQGNRNFSSGDAIINGVPEVEKDKLKQMEDFLSID